MTSTHDQTDHVDRELHDEIREDAYRLREQMRAVRAIVNQGEPDYLASIYAASERLYALLALPDERPGSWEAPHVTALAEQLCEVLDALKAERPEQYKADGGDL